MSAAGSSERDTVLSHGTDSGAGRVTVNVEVFDDEGRLLLDESGQTGDYQDIDSGDEARRRANEDPESRFTALELAALYRKRRSRVGWSIFNLSNTIVGAGVLALPLAFARTGMLLGAFMLVGIALISDYSLKLLAASCVYSKCRSYPELAVWAYGKRFARWVDIAAVVFMYGTCVAYLIIIGDLLPSFLKYEVCGDDAECMKSFFLGRIFMMCFVTFAIIIPIGLLRSLHSLRYTSLVALACIVYLVFLVAIRTSSVTPAHPEENKMRLASVGLDLALAIPVLAFAYSCHSALPSILGGFRPPASQKESSAIHRFSVSICTAVYMLVGIFGYLTFYDKVDPNILNSYCSNDIAAALGRVGLSVTLIFSFPIMLYCCRDHLDHAIFNRDEVQVSATFRLDDVWEEGAGEDENGGNCDAYEYDDDSDHYGSDREERRSLSVHRHTRGSYDGDTGVKGSPGPKADEVRVPVPKSEGVEKAGEDGTDAQGAEGAQGAQGERGAADHTTNSSAPVAHEGHEKLPEDQKGQSGTGGHAIPLKIWIMETVGICVASLVLAILFPNVDSVFGLTGATSCVFLNFICPPLFYLRTLPKSLPRWDRQKLPSYAIMVFAAAVGLISTPVELYELISPHTPTSDEDPLICS